MIIPFGDWLPDLGNFNNPGALQAKNVIPTANGNYRSFPAPIVLSDALTARCQGAFSTLRASNNDAYVYSGDATKLYQLVGNTTHTDASKSGGYNITSDDFWEFVRFGDTIIATNISDPLQSITIGGANFADLATSTLKPQARRIGATENFVILGDMSEGGTKYPYRVRWSALNDAADYDASANTQSDFQDFADGEQIMKIIGIGRDAYVFQRRGIHAMRYEGTPTVFRFDQVEKDRGLIAGQGIVSFGGYIFYIADDGFYQFDGMQSHPIGREKIDQFFFDDLAAGRLELISAAIDPVHSLVAWAYPTASGGQNIPDRILVYSWAVQKWALIHTDTQFIFRDVSKGFTLDDLDSVSSTLEGLPFSLDSRVWSGGSIMIFSGFNADNKIISFDGDPLPATLDTKEMNLMGRQRAAFFDGVWPIVDSPGTVTVAVGDRDTLQEAEEFGAATGLNAIGEADIRSCARYHRFRVTATGGLTMAHGVEVDPRPGGRQ